MLGYGFGGLELVVMPLALVGVVLLGIVALAGGRNEPDPTGQRARAMYVSLVSFVAIFMLLFAIGTAATALANMAFAGSERTVDCAADPFQPECVNGIGSFDLEDSSSEEAVDAGRTRDALNAAAVGAAALGVLFWHRSRTREMLDDPSFEGSPGERTYRAYLYAVAFVAVVVLLIAAASAAFGLIRWVAADSVTAGSTDAEQDGGLVQLVTSLVTGGAAAYLYVTHWKGIGGPGPRKREPEPEPAA